MIWILLFTFVLYAILIISLTLGFIKVDEFQPNKNTPKITFSVVIPFRNEAENLSKLLASIQELNYPKELVEFIFVDDDSSDNSVAIIQKILSTISQKSKITQTNISLLKNKRTSNSPKKDAISTAISLAKNNWIVTTDADCLVLKNWLRTIALFIQQNKPKMVVAPVNYNTKNSFLDQFQLLDFMSMQGSTIGGFGIGFPFLCNGANLAYLKEDFLRLNGFNGNNTIASGDDIFLFEKFLESDKNSVQILKSKEAIVTTFPVKSWTDLKNQRIRWAAKTSNFKSVKVKLIGLLVFITNFLIIYYLCTASLQLLFIPFLLKIIVDLFLFISTNTFFNHKKTWLKWYVFSSILYPFFSVYIVFLSVTTKYNWKGRSFKK